MQDSNELFAEYVACGSETAFRELVTRYVDLVYSTALRLVRDDSHLAEDVAQTVFSDLARLARTLSPQVMLGGWLHRHTCFIASRTMRGERRRQNRERIAMELNAVEDHAEANLQSVAPVLDEAVNSLGTQDRQAILLRFFEQRDFRAIGTALGSNEEAARKRVHRALDKLHLLLKRRGLTLSAAALATALNAEAVAVAPAGLAATLSGTALTTAASGGAALTFINIITMTKLQAGLFGAIVLALAIPLFLQTQSRSALLAENAVLRQEMAKIAPLKAENERLGKLAMQAANAPRQSTEQLNELMKLRNEVGRLRRQEASEAMTRTNGPSVLSGITATPETQKLIHDQQKAGLKMIYGDFAKTAKLSPEQADKLNELLADHVMTNISNVTAVLHDHKSGAEINQIFGDQDAALQGEVQSLLGPDGLAQYQDYTRNLISHLSSEQFKTMLGGDDAAKAGKTAQLYQAMLEESQATLNRAGLDADYQLVPTLNLRNIASTEEADKNLGLLDSTYANVEEKAKAFLSPEEVSKFEEFRATAIKNSRAALDLNRKMMAPTSK